MLESLVRSRLVSCFALACIFSSTACSSTGGADDRASGGGSSGGSGATSGSGSGGAGSGGVCCGSGATGSGTTGSGGSATGAGGVGGNAGGSTGSGGSSSPDPACMPGDAMQVPDADNPCIRLHGRWDRSDPKAPIARWGAVYITAKFEGTSIKARMSDEHLSVTTVWNDMTYELGPNVYQVSIDGGAPTVFPATMGTDEYTLATGLADGEHTVELVRWSESKYGKTTFRGFVLDEGKHLLVPDAGSGRKVEIFGDSISAGLANENKGPYNAATSNGYAAYGPTFARLVDAEWHVEARGGGSFYTGFLPMVPWFDKTFGPLDGVHKPEDRADDPVPTWDFGTWQPDVLIIALGTNDASAPAEWNNFMPYIPPEDDYTAKYSDFLVSLRGWYPDAWIFALAPWKEGEEWDVVRSAIGNAAEQQGDAKIEAIIPLEGTHPSYTGRWLTYPEDYVTGDDFHPNLQGNDKIARKLKEIIAPKVGW